MATLLAELRMHVHPLYWTARDMPAFARLGGRDALRAWWPYARRSLRHWQPWTSLAVVPVAAAAVGLLAAWGLMAAGLVGGGVQQTVLVAGAAAAVGGGLSGNYWAAFINRLALADHPELCRACGYDCSASPGRCPECGTPAADAGPMRHNATE